MRVTDSPRDRLGEVTLGLAADKALPNVLLGAFLGFSIQSVAGGLPWVVSGVSGGLWLASVVTYTVADEVTDAIEEQKKKTLSDESDYYGIE